MRRFFNGAPEGAPYTLRQRTPINVDVVVDVVVNENFRRT
jgi:hypothetical protein